MEWSRPFDLVRQVAALLALPRAVQRFYVRSLAHTLWSRDRFSWVAAAGPRDLRVLTGRASGRRTIVEIGTGTGWSAAALVLSDPACVVHTFDVQDRAGRESYLARLPAEARARIHVHIRPGQDAPGEIASVDLLFIDGAHQFDPTIELFTAWRPRLAPGALVVFHDYAHPAFPGIRRAIEHLGLDGDAVGNIFLWRN
jgi:predicted O-methyltransferase YrrM